MLGDFLLGVSQVLECRDLHEKRLWPDLMTDLACQGTNEHGG